MTSFLHHHHHLLLLSLFLFFFQSSEAISAPVVKLPIHEQDYLCVMIGNPGRSTCLFIDHHCNETIILYQEPTFTSQTFTLNPASVLVFLGPHGFRFNAVFEERWRDRSPYIDNKEGKLCFGQFSQIWTFWRSATFSPTFLVLGGFDRSLTRSTYHNFELEFDPFTPIEVQVGDDVYFLMYDPTEIYTFLPSALYHNVTALDIILDEDSHRIHIGLDDDDITISNPLSLFAHSTLKRHLASEDEISFGRVFTHKFVIYFDAVSLKRYVFPSVDFFNYGNTRFLYATITSVLYTVILIVWLGAVLVKNGQSARLLTLIEAYIYLTGLIMLYIEIEGFVSQRFISYFTRSDNNVLFMVLTFFVLFNIALGSFLAWIHQDTFEDLKTRRLTLETVCFVMLWISQLHECHDGMNNLFLLTIAGLYANLRLIQMCFYYVYERFDTVWMSLCYSIFGLFFFIIYNLKPLIEFYFWGNKDPVGATILLVVLFCLLPSLYFTIMLNQAAIRKSILNTSKPLNDFIHKKKNPDSLVEEPHQQPFPSLSDPHQKADSTTTIQILGAYSRPKSVPHRR
jgi:hypothetical protein